jgi:hypothetical protein
MEKFAHNGADLGGVFRIFKTDQEIATSCNQRIWSCRHSHGFVICRIVWGSSGKQAIYLRKLVRCISKASESDRKLLLSLAQKVAVGRSRQASAQA